MTKTQLQEFMRAAVAQILADEAKNVEAGIVSAVTTDFICRKCCAGLLQHTAVLQDNDAPFPREFLRLACPGDVPP